MDELVKDEFQLIYMHERWSPHALKKKQVTDHVQFIPLDLGDNSKGNFYWKNKTSKMEFNCN